MFNLFAIVADVVDFIMWISGYLESIMLKKLSTVGIELYKSICFQKHVCYFPQRALSQSVKSQTVASFLDLCLCLLPHFFVSPTFFFNLRNVPAYNTNLWLLFKFLMIWSMKTSKKTQCVWNVKDKILTKHQIWWIQTGTAYGQYIL